MNGEIRSWTGKMQEVYAPIFLEGTEEKVQFLTLDNLSKIPSLKSARQ